MSLPTGASDRKNLPIFSGVLMYFPDAIAEVAYVSKLGNDQHNPGEPLHWAREKSTDQCDCIIRHTMDHGSGNIKDDGGKTYHMAKAAWRALAELQLTIEKERANGIGETNTTSHGWTTEIGEINHGSRTIQGPKGPYSTEGCNTPSITWTTVSTGSGANGQGDEPVHDQELVSSRT